MAETQNSTQQSTAQSSGQSGTYFQDPNLVNQLSNTLSSVGNQSAGQYMNFVNNPTASPLFTNQLSGLLQALQPSEAAARTNLQDTGRAAGMMASGPFAHAAQNQESDILRNRQTLASQLLGQMFPQMTQALQQPMTLAEQLINALKMQQSSQQSNSQSSGQSTGTKTDPAQQQQNSGISAAQLLAALTGGNKQTATAPTSGQTGNTLQVGQPTPTGTASADNGYYDPNQSNPYMSGYNNNPQSYQDFLQSGTFSVAPQQDWSFYNSIPQQPQWDTAIPESMAQ